MTPSPLASPSAGRRDRVLAVRLAPEELEEIRSAALAARFGRTAMWARRELLCAAAGVRSVSPEPREVSPVLMAHLTRVGGNLNQVARHLNMTAVGARSDAIDARLVADAVAAVRAVLADVLREVAR